MTGNDLILAALAAGPLRSDALANATGLTGPKVRRQVSRLRLKGLVCSHGKRGFQEPQTYALVRR